MVIDQRSASSGRTNFRCWLQADSGWAENYFCFTSRSRPSWWCRRRSVPDPKRPFGIAATPPRPICYNPYKLGVANCLAKSGSGWKALVSVIMPRRSRKTPSGSICCPVWQTRTSARSGWQSLVIARSCSRLSPRFRLSIRPKRQHLLLRLWYPRLEDNLIAGGYDA